MLPKGCRFNVCFAYLIFWILTDALEVQGSHLKCCFNVLKNRSVSYQLSEPPGPSCTITWSAMEVVVMDEDGNVDESMVVYHEPSKIILNVVKQLTYRQDCRSTGNSYKGTCYDSCAAVDVPTEATPQHTEMTPIIIPIVVIIFIITITVIGCKTKKHFIKSQLETQYQV